nr:nodulation protein NodJ [Oxalobacteraceae bacterium]
MSALTYRLPALSLRFVPVWRRNLLVWRKLAVASVIGNIAEPMITLLAFGYGLGSLLQQIEGVPYIEYLASGSICMSVMMAASFESLYSAFSRMHVQKTWDALLNTPLELDDIVLAEMLWAASKAMISGVAI